MAGFGQVPERTLLLVDGANLYATTGVMRARIDFNKLLRVFKTESGCYLSGARYYTAIDELATGEQPLRGLVEHLAYNGWTVVSKEAKSYVQADGRRKVKGNMDIEIACDMLKMAPHVDRLILFTGDGDFARAIRDVQELGRRVSVVSTMTTQPPMISNDLRKAADSFIELAGMLPHISQ